MVRRYDAGEFSTSVERLDNGYLRADAHITRTGVFTYRLQDGKTRRELRLPDEVFRRDALDSFELAPLTNDHPAGLLNAKNTGKHQVGTVSNVRQDGDHVAARVQVTDVKAIEAAENGKRELSCGYDCRLDFEPGVTAGIDGVPDGLRYDAIQRDIKGNHVALVAVGRAGDSASIHLDSDDAIRVDDWRADRDPSTIQTLIFAKEKFSKKQADEWAKAHDMPGTKPPDETGESFRFRQIDPGAFVEGSFRTIDLAPGVKAVIGRRKDSKPNRATGPKPKGEKMDTKKITLDGVDFEVSEQVAQAVQKLTARCDALGEEIQQAKARADKAEEDLAAEKKARADAENPERLRERVDARLTLEREAAPILGDETKLDAMADDEIKAAVVMATAADKDGIKAKLDGCDPAYLQARYDSAVESWEPPKPNAGNAAARKATVDSAQGTDADAARKRMIESNAKLWQVAS